MVNNRLKEILASDSIKLTLVVVVASLVFMSGSIFAGILDWLYTQQAYYGLTTVFLTSVFIAIIIFAGVLIGITVGVIVLATLVSKKWNLSPVRSDKNRLVKTIVMIASAVLAVVFVWLYYQTNVYDVFGILISQTNYGYLLYTIFFLILSYVLTPLFFAYVSVLIVDLSFWLHTRLTTREFQPTRWGQANELDEQEDVTFKGYIKAIFIIALVILSIFVISKIFRPYSIVKFNFQTLRYPTDYNGTAFTGNETITFENFSIVYTNDFNSTGYPISFGLETKQIFENPTTMAQQSFIFKIPKGYFVPFFIIGGTYQYNDTTTSETFVFIGWVGYSGVLPTGIDMRWKVDFLTKSVAITGLNADWSGSISAGYFNSTVTDTFDLIDALIL